MQVRSVWDRLIIISDQFICLSIMVEAIFVSLRRIRANLVTGGMRMIA
jgi:hypothetical protein